MSKSETYNDNFYCNRNIETQKSADFIVSYIKDFISIESVVDVGCGVGTWLATFRNYGASKILGLDGSWVPTQYLVIEEENFRQTELDKPFALEGNYDLAMSLEVAEHLPECRAVDFIEKLTAAAPAVLFSAAIPGQTGDGHINEQWPEYWINIFNKFGYKAIDCIRSRFWDNSEVAWWYSQNTFLYVKKEIFEKSDNINKEIIPLPTNLVHPMCLSRRGITDDMIKLSTGDRKSYACIFMNLISKWHSSYALYGAGKHTKWLISICSDFGFPLPQVIYDIDPGNHIEGVPVVSPNSGGVSFPEVVILSSDQPETLSSMREQLENIDGAADIQIYNPYDGVLPDLIQHNE